eukprot:snap_masked-scaffold_14-processed-gene-4.30-mRNA-1 protein AED:1.00 eAED:1.00 QI:0/0/0/0/1/1/2/0/281
MVNNFLALKNNILEKVNVVQKSYYIISESLSGVETVVHYQTSRFFLEHPIMVTSHLTSVILPKYRRTPEEYRELLLQYATENSQNSGKLFSVHDVAFFSVPSKDFWQIFPGIFDPKESKKVSTLTALLHCCLLPVLFSLLLLIYALYMFCVPSIVYFSLKQGDSFKEILLNIFFLLTRSQIDEEVVYALKNQSYLVTKSGIIYVLNDVSRFNDSPETYSWLFVANGRHERFVLGVIPEADPAREQDFFWLKKDVQQSVLVHRSELEAIKQIQGNKVLSDEV